MIKKTLYFGNPAYLSMKLQQMVIKKPSESNESELVKAIPIEDIGIVILDNRQISITQGLISSLLENKTAVITCAENHMPNGLLLTLDGNTLQNERYRSQINASLPLNKQLWQQTVKMKILNQAEVLYWKTGKKHEAMYCWAREVKSGDRENHEARAAAYYWKNLFGEDFIRGRYEGGVNDLLNYGYAILRAIVARGLVASGLMPTLGIHHHNRYNAYCLADDIMEPYRPYVDKLVVEIIRLLPENDEIKITKEAKVKLLSIPILDVNLFDKRSPLSVAVSSTTASLVKSFDAGCCSVVYPQM